MPLQKNAGLGPESQEFLSFIARTQRQWQSLDLRIAAVRIANTWQCISAVCRLRHQAPKSVPTVKHLPRTSSFWACQIRLPASRLSDLLEQVCRGSIDLASEPILCRAAPLEEHHDALKKIGYSSNTPNPLHAWRPDQAAVLRAPGATPPFTTMHRLLFTGEQVSTFLSKLEGGRDTLDKQLRSLRVHWDGLEHVIAAGIGALNPFDTQSAVGFDFLAAVGLAIDGPECSFQNEIVRVSILADSARARRLASVTIIDTDLPPSGNPPLKISAANWQSHPDGFHGDLSVQSNATKKVVLHLRHAGEAIGRIVLVRKSTLANQLLSGHQQFDPGLKIWKEKMLTVDGANAKPLDARSFERDVGRLFGVLGFSVDIIEDRGDRECLDILAHASGYPLIAIECTVSSLKSEGKLAKLFRRSERLRTSLQPTYTVPEIPHGIRERAPVLPDWRRQAVISVIVSALSDDDVSSAERIDAGRDGIAVLCRDDLTFLLDLAATAPDLNDVFAHINSRVEQS